MSEDGKLRALLDESGERGIIYKMTQGISCPTVLPVGDLVPQAIGEQPRDTLWRISRKPLG